MTDNPFKPPSTKSQSALDPSARARSTARWMRIFTSLHFLGALLFVACAVAAAMNIAQQPGLAITALFVFGGVASLLVWFAGSLLRSASRLRRGAEQRSPAILASAFVPLRRYFIGCLVLESIALIFIW